MRRTPAEDPPAWTVADSGRITQVREYEVIAPLFGGGVETKQADPVTIVRASEVRGQLRFWWRATRNGQFGGKIKELKDAEDRLWGSTEHPSLVDVEVTINDPGVLIDKVPNQQGRSVQIGAPASPLSYGAFPLRDGGGLRFGIVFTLTITFPSTAQNAQEVQAALWAWETFGGLGARTRRGFGALACRSIRQGDTTLAPQLPPSANPAQLSAWIRQQLAVHVVSEQPIADVPHLHVTTSPTIGRLNQRFAPTNGQFAGFIRDMLRTGGIAQPTDRMVRALVAWYYPIEQMKTFRQSRRRSESNGSRFGRSYWPEPDEIRQRTCGFRGRHAQRLTTAPKFPRAAFGLPIVFRFKDEDIDPPGTTLQGAKHSRLASRLVLRPLACADGQVASVAILLEAPALPPDGLKLEDAEHHHPIDTRPLSAAEAGFPPLNGNPGVLQAFLATL